MDSSQERTSGIPRLSRLPVARGASAIPRPASTTSGSATIRSKPSRDSIGGGVGARELQSPKLRAPTSRSQLRPSIDETSGQEFALNRRASRDQLRASTIRTSTAKPTPQPTPSKPRVPRIASTPQRRTSSIAVSRTPVQHIESVADPDIGDVEEPAVEQDLKPLNLVQSFHDDGPSSNAARAAPIDPVKPRSSKPRPSLSERTMETLAGIPSSPALKKKSSSFFEQNRPRSRAESGNSRPGSSYNSDGSGRTPSRPASRPGSSTDREDAAPSTSRPATSSFKSHLSTIDGTPEPASGGRGANTPKSRVTGRLSLAAAGKLESSSSDVKSPSLSKRTPLKAPLKSGSKTVAARPLKPRGSVSGLFKKPSLQALDRSVDTSDSPSRASRSSTTQSSDPWDGAIQSPRPALKGNSGEPATPSTSRKSSSALRDQIAKARAAKRAAVRQESAAQAPSAENEMSIVPSDDGFDFGVGHDDPFNTRHTDGSQVMVLKNRIATARTTGRMNIAALGLKEIPGEVMNMYDLGSMGVQDGRWAESVDLTRLVAADNELEVLDDTVFPDSDPRAFDDDDEGHGNIFGGLEVLDMHGNKLIHLPMGFRRLAQLTSLNLSSNCLENSSLDIIAEMTALRDLKLAKNKLSGGLNPNLLNLEALEILDLSGNTLTSLPSDLDRMSRLRILNLGENSIGSLPFAKLAKLPLTELNLRKNKLIGTLIEEPVEALPLLQTLDVSMNQLIRLVPAGSVIRLPVVHALTLSVNRLQELPDMTTWTSLLTLAADENSISTIPASFTTLEKIRHADFGGNDIRIVPPEIARMGSLSMIRLTGNPLRDRKFASATIDELKGVLNGRLEPPPPYQEPGDQSSLAGFGGKAANMDRKAGGYENADGSDFEDDFATPPTSAPHSPTRSRSNTVSSSRSRSQTLANQSWPVKPGGLLDRSRTELSSLNPKMCSDVAAQNQVRQLQLHHNLFTAIPISMSFFGATLSSLSLSHNQLAGDAYLIEDLDLPALRELNISSNHITSLKPLVTFLRAPMLDKIDASFNRMNCLPLGLKDAFPRLNVLLASNNQLAELIPDSIRGLRIVDAGSNDIAHLDPRIGLLGGQAGLQRLEVTGNRFKVPRWNILERGTESTLHWLRGRVPLPEMEAWSRENGEQGDGGVD